MKISLVLIILMLSGCASEKPKGKTKAEILYKEALKLSKDERYLLATEKINQLKNQYPYSYYATPAELLLADIYFDQDSFIEAAASYILFRDFHPKHERISYVIYRIAESYYKQLPETNDRDLEAAGQAIRYYTELVSKYPRSPYTKKAAERIEECHERKRNYEQYVADFYFKTKKYKAALWRYNYILDSFRKKKLRSHSMQRIVASNYFLKEYKTCLEFSEEYTPDLIESDKKLVEQYRTFCTTKLK